MFLLFEGQSSGAADGNKEPEDIFSGVEEKKSAPALSGAANRGEPPVNLPTGAPAAPVRPPAADVPPRVNPAAPSAPQIEKTGAAISNRTFLWGAGAVAVVAVLVLGSYGVARFLRKAQIAGSTPPISAPAAPVIVETPVPEVAEEIPAVIDTDGDGLTDEQEIALGTDPQEADTDKDGLFDGEEGETYGTDPLNPDSDGDTFPDGQEVRNGYNPKGTGRLFEIPTE